MSSDLPPFLFCRHRTLLLQAFNVQLNALLQEICIVPEVTQYLQDIIALKHLDITKGRGPNCPRSSRQRWKFGNRGILAEDSTVLSFFYHLITLEEFSISTAQDVHAVTHFALHNDVSASFHQPRMYHWRQCLKEA